MTPARRGSRVNTRNLWQAWCEPPPRRTRTYDTIHLSARAQASAGMISTIIQRDYRLRHIFSRRLSSLPTVQLRDEVACDLAQVLLCVTVHGAHTLLADGLRLQRVAIGPKLLHRGVPATGEVGVR